MTVFAFYIRHLKYGFVWDAILLLYAHAQNGRMTTSTAGLMTEEMAVYQLVEQQLSTKKANY